MREMLYEVLSRDVEKYEDLVRRARQADDGELAEFFDRLRREDGRLARDAERLLAERIPE